MPSFDLLPGAERSPVVLHVPHSGREIPAEVRAGIVLDDSALERELDHIVDAHTARLAEETAHQARVAPWRFVNRLSRLVVDPERFPDEREGMLAVGVGAGYTKTTGGGGRGAGYTKTTGREELRAADTDPEPLLARYFRPYAGAMTDAVAQRLAVA